MLRKASELGDEGWEGHGLPMRDVRPVAGLRCMDLDRSGSWMGQMKVESCRSVVNLQAWGKKGAQLLMS